jgi:hypothetical protein
MGQEKDSISEWLDSLMSDLPVKEAIEVVQPSQVEPRRRVSAAEIRAEKLRGIEDEMLQKSMSIINDSLHFADVDFSQENPKVPDEWMEELKDDTVAVERRMRIAKYAMLSAKNAPIGLVMANRFAVGVIKARATEKVGNRTLNVAVVQLPVASHPYPIIDEESSDGRK